MLPPEPGSKFCEDFSPAEPNLPLYPNFIYFSWYNFPKGFKLDKIIQKRIFGRIIATKIK